MAKNSLDYRAAGVDYTKIDPLKIDAQRAAAAQHVGRTAAAVEVALRVGGVHAAVAIDGNAQRHIPAQHLVVAEFRNGKEIAAANCFKRISF